jgi:DNA invertase Pin-like site-specific DNA recombinase
MIAAYLRVSSRGQNVETQRAAILRAAKARGERVAEWFSEKQSSKALLRPELERLKVAARAGEIAKLYVYRLDRLSRGGIRETLSIVDELRHVGCEIETVGDGFSLRGPGGEIVMAVFAWAAQMERAAIGERIAAARVRVEASGGNWGRPQRVSEADITRIRKLRRDEGKTVREIAVALKIPHGTVQNVLSKKGAYRNRLPGLRKTRAKSLAAPLSR